MLFEILGAANSKHLDTEQTAHEEELIGKDLFTSGLTIKDVKGTQNCCRLNETVSGRTFLGNKRLA